VTTDYDAMMLSPRVKKQDILLLSITLSNVVHFQNYFTVGLGRRAMTRLIIKDPPHLKRVATLPREMQMSGN